jgi:hypothetical protein
LRIGEWDCKIFCPKHTKLGRIRVENLKKKRERGEPSDRKKRMIENESDDE